MLTSKERSYLMGQSAKLPTMTHVGKNGLNEGVIAQLNDLLDRLELVKVGVLKNSGTTAKQLIDEMCATLMAEPVHAIGNKVILYRRSDREGVEHVPLSDSMAAMQAKQKAQRDKEEQKAKAKAKMEAYKNPYRPEKKHGVHKGKGSKPTKK